MSDRLRNNIFAALIVFAFWCIQFSVMAADPVVSESTQTIISNGKNETKVESPPPSAISPQMTTGTSNFLCTVSASAAVQTQILGLSFGGFHSDELCALLSKAQALHNYGMKVASISLLCTDPDIFRSMAMAGSPCPYMGLTGSDAQAAWDAHTDQIPTIEEEHALTAEERRDNMLKLMSGMAAAFLFF